MDKWLEAYEEAKRQRLIERANFRRNRTTRSQPYTENLQILPEFPTSRWLEATISKAKRDGITISKEEEEFTLGCDWHVSYDIKVLFV